MRQHLYLVYWREYLILERCLSFVVETLWSLHLRVVLGLPELLFPLVLLVLSSCLMQCIASCESLE